jgi:hypothetical protein
MSASNYLENTILDHLTSNASYTPPATFYVSLHTGNPGETGASNEVSGGSYSRKDVAYGSEWTSAASGSIENVNPIEFVQATANWGTITHFAIWDAVSGGNCLLYGALSSSKTVTADDFFEFGAGDLTITCD